MTTVQGTYGPQDPGQGDKEEGKQGTDGPQDPEKEGDKEEVKQVREDHPDNPEEKNTIEDMEDEHPFEGQGINAGRSAPQKAMEDHPENLEEENAGEDMEGMIDRLVKELYETGVSEKTEPSKKKDHNLLIPKVEEISESKKKPDYEQAITVSSESLNPHLFAGKQKTDKLGDASSASVTAFVPSPELLVKVADRKASRLQYQANNPPPRDKENRPLVLSHNLRSPSEPGTQVKGVLIRYAVSTLK